jgi:hypothetical protein
VYPRSHRVMERYFRENGFDAVRTGGLEALPRLPLARPIQVCAEPGDVVLAHYLLAHSIAPNTSPNIRYAVYFRVSMHPGDVHHAESMTNAWSEWPAMAALQAKDKAADQKEGVGAGAEGDGGGEMVRPVYADELFRSQDAFLDAKDKERAALRERADKAFAAHDWTNGAPLWKALGTELTEDFEVQLKAGMCFTFKPGDSLSADELKFGEASIRRAIDLHPTYPNALTVLAFNLNRQKPARPQEAVEAVWRMLRCPPNVDEVAKVSAEFVRSGKPPAHNFVVDGIKAAAAALGLLGAENADVELSAMVAEAKAQYPEWSGLIDAANLVSEGATAGLWVRGKAWIASPKKDFAVGEQLFGAIVRAKPGDYWATLLLGGCKLWSGRPALAEPHLRTAIGLDPALPNGYAVLAQCLALQWRPADAHAVVEDMVGKEFKTIPTTANAAVDPDAAKQITDALGVAENVLGGRGAPAYRALVERAIVTYPTIAHKIKATSM